MIRNKIALQLLLLLKVERSYLTLSKGNKNEVRHGGESIVFQ